MVSNVILIVLLILAFYYSKRAYLYIVKYNFLIRNGIKSEAVIVNHIQNPKSRGLIPILEFYVEDKIVNTSIIHSEFTFSSAVYSLGKKVMIYYDKSNPQICVINSKLQILAIYVTLLPLYGCCIFLIIYNFILK